MATLSFEVELELDGAVSRYQPATYWDPAEGGEVEDLAIADVGVLERVERTWIRKSILTGVDTSNIHVQRLLDNLLELVRDDALSAVVEDELARAA